MIAYLKGKIAEISENNAVIDVSGVGYLFFASTNTLAKLGIGENATILTEMIIREDSHTLYGFFDKKEQNMFRLLTTVQGVGPKVCIGILSSLNVSDINRAIASADTKLIGKANGVGPKLATRIVTELKGKVENNFEGISLNHSEIKANSEFENAVSALVNLGYQRMEAVFAIDKVLADNKDADLPKIIKLSLKEMGKK